MTNTLVRTTGFFVIALAAVAVWWLMAPEEAPPSSGLSTKDYTTLINAALSDATANEALADSAPQQQVVNGWVARDLLSIMASQNVDLLRAVGALSDTRAPVTDERPAALLVLGVVAICWLGVTNPTTGGPRAAVAPWAAT